MSVSGLVGSRIVCSILSFLISFLIFAKDDLEDRHGNPTKSLSLFGMMMPGYFTLWCS